MDQDCQCSRLANQGAQVVLKVWETFYVAIEHKSWVSSELFEKWVKEIDVNFGAQKRKIDLIIDNYPAHPDVLPCPPRRTSAWLGGTDLSFSEYYVN